MNQPKEILMITDTFFPKRVISAFRAGKFCKYLSEFGWQPVVLTLKDCYYGREFDYSLLDDVKGVPVIKTDMIGAESLKVLYMAVRRVFSRKARTKDTGTVAFSSSRSRKWIDFFTLWSEPTQGIGWLPFGILKGYTSAKKSDAIWATAPLPGALCLGAALAKLTGKPFVADLRDPWRAGIDHPYPTRIHKAIDNYLLNFVFKTATKVVVVTDTMVRDYQGQFPQYADKLERIYNGYDSADIEKPSLPIKQNGSNTITIAYLGTLYQGREEYMHKLLQSLNNIHFSLNGINIRIFYRGPSQNIFDTLVKKQHCEEFCNTGGSVSYAEAMEAMNKADIVLLLGSPAHIYALPGKIFEHIGTNKPTLYIGPHGEAWEFINEYKIGECIDLSNECPEAISAILDKLVNNRGIYAENLSHIKEQFTRRRATQHLVNLLDRIVTRP